MIEDDYYDDNYDDMRSNVLVRGIYEQFTSISGTIGQPFDYPKCASRLSLSGFLKPATCQDLFTHAYAQEDSHFAC